MAFKVLFAYGCVFVTVLALPYENVYGPEYGYEWILFYDENGYTHDLNFSVLPDETRGILYGDIYFYLYTRQNTDPEELHIPNTNDAFKSQYFDSSKPTKVITHGWLSSYQSQWLQDIRQAFLTKGDFNVITVDWNEIAKNPAYPWPAFSTRFVGKKVAELLDSMADAYGIDGSGMHLMGHSLGSHVMGHTSQFSKLRMSRITGLDPARPLFEIPLISKEYRLDKTDAEFVDIIHSCGGIYGYMESHGHADFYPNSGEPRQPGCEGKQEMIEGCSHGRSTLFYAESINSEVPFTSYPCENWEKFEKGECRDHSTNMGDPVSKDSLGNYFLYTNSEPKFARGAE